MALCQRGKGLPYEHRTKKDRVSTFTRGRFEASNTSCITTVIRIKDPLLEAADNQNQSGIPTRITGWILPFGLSLIPSQVLCPLRFSANPSHNVRRRAQIFGPLFDFLFSRHQPRCRTETTTTRDQIKEQRLE